MFDAIARRYGTLPSNLLNKADTFDLMVFDVAVTYEQYLQNKQQGKVDQSMYDQEELKDLMNKVRGNGK